MGDVLMPDGLTSSRGRPAHPADCHAYAYGCSAVQLQVQQAFKLATRTRTRGSKFRSRIFLQKKLISAAADCGRDRGREHCRESFRDSAGRPRTQALPVLSPAFY